MNLRHFFIVLFLSSFFLHSGFSQQPDDSNSNATEVFENYQESIFLNQSQFLSRKFIASSFSNFKEVGIEVLPLDLKSSNGAISIYYSISNNFPNNASYDKVCLSLKSFDSCVFGIPSSENSTTIYISIFCESSICRYKWRINHIDEITLIYGTPDYYVFYKYEFEAFNLTIPAKENFSRIIFSIEYLYVPAQYQIKTDITFNSGKPLRKHLTDRQILIFSNSDAELCASCNITSTILLPKTSIINVEAWCLQDVNEIHLNETITDFLFSMNRNSYLLNIDENLLQPNVSSLFISFKSLSGTKKTLYVSADKEINDSSQAQWNSTLINEYYEEEDIVVNKEDLNILGLKGNKFYLYVTGDINGLYMIHINVHSQRFLPLHLGIIESGLIANNEIINYEFEFWKSDDYQRLTLSATMNTGHLNFYGRQCEDFNACQLITKTDIDQNNSIQYKVTQNGLNMLEFTPKCKFFNSPVCYFIFAIMGNSVSTINSKYSLSLKHSQNIIVLMENVFHESHVEIFHSEIYKLIVEDHATNEVLSIMFLINNDLVYFVNKDNLCFDIESPNCDVKYGNSLYPVVFENQEGENKSLNGVYYMMILGVERSNILIYPRVIRKGSETQIIKLLEGRTFKSALMQSVRKEYFKFHISSESAILVEINLESSVIHGMKIYLSNNNKLPGTDNYFLSSHNGYISFTHYPTSNDEIYMIAIESNLNFEAIPDHKLNYILMYSTEATLKHLEPNHFFYDFVERGKTKKFIFFPGVDQYAIIISKNVVSPPEANAYLKMNLSILMKEDQYQNEYTLEKDIILNKSVLEKFCGAKKTIDECPFFVTLENTFDETLHYSLVLRYKEHSIGLIDGKEQSFLLETETKLFMHYTPFSKDDQLDVYSYSYGIPFDLYFLVYHNINKTESEEWPFEDAMNSPIKYSGKNNYYIPFKGSIFNFCWPNCEVLIALNVNNTEFNIAYSPSHKVHIMLSSKMAELFENKPLIFTIENQQPKHLSYDLSHFLNSSLETLCFDLNNFFGEPRLYLTVNSAEYEKLPNNDQYDFISQTGNLLLTKTEILALKRDLSMGPHLHIVIFCLSPSCETTLNFKTASFQLKHLIHGRPFAIFLEKNQKERFEYFHYSNKPFHVKFNRETGDGSLSLISCPPDKNISYDDCVNKAINHEEIADITDFWSNSITMNDTDSNYCMNCVYILTFVATSEVKGTINLVLQDEFLQLQEGKKVSDEVQEDNYNLYMIKIPFNTEIKALLNVYSGLPELYLSKLPHLNRKQYELFVESKNKSQIEINFKRDTKNEDNSSEVNIHLYLLVYSPEYSRYSITYKTAESIIFLHEGLIEFDTLKSGKTNRYVFEIYHQQSRPTLSMNLKQKPSSPEFFKIELFFRAQKNPYDSSNQLAPLILSKDDMVLSETSLMFMLLNSTGHYEIHLTNSNANDVSYSLIINTQFINMIPYNSVVNQIIPADKAIFYETFAPNKGFLMFDLLQCVGEVKLFVSEDYAKFKNALFDEEFQGSEGISRVNVIKVNKGMVYFALYSTSSYNRHYPGMSVENRTKGYYKLITHFYDSPEEIPENKVVPGGNGRLNWQYMPGKNSIRVNFEPIRCIGLCPEYLKKYLNISYVLMLSINENLLNAYGKCSIVHYENMKFNSSNYQTHLILTESLGHSNNLDQIEHEFEYSNDIYYVSVKAEIHGFPGNMEAYNMYYEDIEVMKPPVKIERVIYFGLTAMAICLVVMLIFCGCYYYKNYKKLEESLNYEVKELDNPGIITTLNASIEMQPSKRYQGLIEDMSAV